METSPSRTSSATHLLAGKRALVTGGAGGLGSGIATALAGAGAHVVLADIAGDRLAEVVARIEADGGTAEAWELALSSKSTPSVLSLTRQGVPTLRTEHKQKNLTAQGAYVLADAEGKRQALLMATGSEVAIAMAARDLLQAEGIGGAQAVAALAHGTETIPPVVKIVGPGNAYVAAAKRAVFGTVGIDMIAGPSEVLVVADGDNAGWLREKLGDRAPNHDGPIVDAETAEIVARIEAEPHRYVVVLPADEEGVDEDAEDAADDSASEQA